MATGKPMRTCWVLDHPAHVRLLAPFLRAGQSNDVIIATRRKEVENLLESGDGHIPRRQTHWVERPVGETRRQNRVSGLAGSKGFFGGGLSDPPWFILVPTTATSISG